jgi:methyltransferase (TIGR00027 family)
MEVERHSMTAVLVAAIRAYHFLGPGPHIFDDSLAYVLLSPAERVAFEQAAVRRLRYLNPTLATSGADTAQIASHSLRAGGGAGALVRARYIEESLLAALARGARQYVIIGAGLDTFAFRRPDLGDRLQVIEIDHPATQASKRDRLARAGLVSPANLFFAAADLEWESVADALSRTPYDRTLPTFFAWPGVMMYLTRKAMFETLQSVVGVADPASELVFDYIEPGSFAPDAPARVRFALHRVRRFGEPLRSGLDPTTLDSELARVGLRLVEDLGPPEVEARFLERAEGFHAVEFCHLVRAAVRRPGEFPG